MRRNGAGLFRLMLGAFVLLMPGAVEAANVLYVVGAPAAAPLVSGAARVWHAGHPDVTIAFSGSGDGNGIAAVIRGSAYMGMVARNLEAVETAMLAERVDVYAVAGLPMDGSQRPGRNLYLLVRKDAPPTVRAFVDFLRSPRGQAMVRAAGYMPVR